ncbi:uncharacterized protein LOC115741237 [Rhodamnia argentea]|uniref:Uncharacterized protein LOC115741237 n=1 Tax=Rhodamnia argentea TaxID=178133 RepID=A0A8B8P806_9MYRT|nr:uncharacterized protein LOC115741237 [Rhodamnia argentea]
MGSISLGVRITSAMAAVASAPSWIPEDDLLLKNAVESGASLEALAKGAVRFSRKFTVGEIRERWHSLLYDPSISAEASARMIECETSAKKSGSCKENPETSGKRKAESIRKIYYAMRKQICSQSANSIFSDEPDVNGFICNESFVHENHIQGHFGGQDPNANVLNPGLVMDSVAAKETSEKGGYLRNDYCNKFNEKVPVFTVKQLVRKDTESSDGRHEDTLSTHVDNSHPKDCAVLEDVEPGHTLPGAGASNHSIELSSPHSRLPIWKTIEDVAAPAILMNDKIPSIEEVMKLCDDLNREHMCLPDHNNSSEKILSDENALKQIGSSTALSENDFVYFSECLWSYGDDLLMDVDEKGTTDKVCNESANLQVLDYANSSVKDDTSVPCPTQTLNSNLASGQDVNFPPTSDFRVDKLDVDHGYQHGSADIDKLSSTAAPDPPLPGDVREELMVCTLNSEDPEIPCNDDFIPSTSYHSHKARSGLSLSSANRGNREQGRSFLKKEKNHTQSSEPCQIMGLQASSNFGPKYPLASSGVKCEFASSNYLNSVSRPALNAHLDRSPCITASGPLHINGEALTKLESSDICNAMTFHLDAGAGPTRDDFQEPQGSPSVVDPEESESGDDVPCFSDIEAMILDMDLCPNDWDTYVGREVSRYSHEDAKRAIVRLEQCVQSSIRRAIASRGGLAVLCGRHLKHYIRKPEVILGRSTYDFDVDIDLGRGGGTNKISRRQALIKLEKDGSFSLKNLGRCSMFLNGREVTSGQRLDLSSGCLIEVKGISFLFEMNPESVGQYLAKLQ